MNALRSLACLAAAATLAACAGAGTVDRVYRASAFSTAELSLASTDNPNWAIVHGNPFAEDRDNRIVVSHVQDRSPSYRLRFEPTHRSDSRYDYRLALAFGRPDAGQPNYCRPDAPPPPRPATGAVEVTVVFCRGEQPLSTASGATEGVARADDPKLAALLGAVTSAVLSPPQSRSSR